MSTEVRTATVARCMSCVILFGCLAMLCQSAKAQGNEATLEQLPDARVSEPYVYNIAFEGMVEPLHFEWQGDFPPGISPEGPRLHGSPSESRNDPYTFSLTLTDALGIELGGRYALRIRPALEPLKIITTNIPTFVLGEQVDFKITATGGEGPYTWEAVSSRLPDELVLECDEQPMSCRLRGTPQQSGDFHITVSVADAYNQDGPVALTGRVILPPPPPLEICTTVLPNGHYNISYQTHLCADGGYPPYEWRLTWRDGQPPEWLSFEPTTGVFSGTPSRVATYRLTAVVTDQQGATVQSQEFAIQVLPVARDPLRLIPSHLPPAVVGLPYTANLAAVNSQGVVSWDLAWETTPAWLTANTEGAYLRLEGTPDEVGMWTLIIKVQDLDRIDNIGSEDAYTFGSTEPVKHQLRVVEPLRLVTDQIPTLVQGKPVDLELAAAGGEGPYRWTVDPSDLPEGLTLQCRNQDEACRLTGIPTEPRPFRVIVAVSDTKQSLEPFELIGQVVAPISPLAICTSTLQPGFARIPYHERLCVSGGQPSYTWQLKWFRGEVPEWLNFDPQTGVFSGTPSQTETYRFTAVVTDNLGAQTRETRFNLEIRSLPLEEPLVAVPERTS